MVDIVSSPDRPPLALDAMEAVARARLEAGWYDSPAAVHLLADRLIALAGCVGEPPRWGRPTGFWRPSQPA